MKYGKFRWCDSESIFNRIGGVKAVGQVLRGELEIVLVPKNPVIDVNRSEPYHCCFDFLGHGAEVWKGPLKGCGKKGDEWIDQRSLALNAIHFTQFEFKKAPFPSNYVRLLESLKESRAILLDAQVAHALYYEKGHRTLEYLRLKQDITNIVFLGTIIRDVHGSACALCLFWHDQECKWEMTRTSIIDNGVEDNTNIAIVK